jgi:DNA processing protein
MAMAQHHDALIPRARYRPPANVRRAGLNECLVFGGREPLEARQFDLLRREGSERPGELFIAGDSDLLRMPSVSIVGTRDVSDDGRRRASRLARELAAAGIVVVSGLAKGVDTAAHRGAIDGRGRTIAVIGTPIEKAYPAENADLQMQIYTSHLLVSPFSAGTQVFKSNFPARNRVMAALSDATVIIEASDSSGTLHQAAECQKLGRWLFITRAVAEDPRLTWPKGFIGKPKVAVLKETDDILIRIRR